MWRFRAPPRHTNTPHLASDDEFSADVWTAPLEGILRACIRVLLISIPLHRDRHCQVIVTAANRPIKAVEFGGSVEWIAMSKEVLNAELFARGQGICNGTEFAGDLLGKTHEFQHSDHRVRVRLPSVEFEPGTNAPIGKGASIAHFRSGFVDDPSLERSFYTLEYVTVEVDFQQPVPIPSVLLEHPAVRKSPELRAEAPHLDSLAVQYEGLLVSAWHHWLRVARWASNQPNIGLSDWTLDGADDLKMPRIFERTTGHAVWAAANVIHLQHPASFNTKTWEHVGSVLARQLTPPIWFEYLVEARARLAGQDFSGCVLSSVIACETLARATYMHLVGTPSNAAAAELVNRTAAQAIIGRWKELTGLKAEGKVHSIFDIRNGLVHSGRTDSVDQQIARDALQTARKFVEAGDEWWFDEQGLPNPRTTNLK